MNIIKILTLLFPHRHKKIVTLFQNKSELPYLTEREFDTQQCESIAMVFCDIVCKKIMTKVRPGGFIVSTKKNEGMVVYDDMFIMRKEIGDKSSSLGLSIRGAIAWGNMLLSFSEDSLLETQILLSFVLGQETSYLYTFPEKILSIEQDRMFTSMLQQRKERQPIAYITGQKGFMSLDFQVSPDVLIPRPETELLVEYVCEIYKDEEILGLDLATGSGCIAISILHYLPHAHFIASDISLAALKVAQKNVLLNKVSDRAFLVNGDMLFPFAQKSSFHLIVSNPPYIAESEYTSLQPELKYEPKLALTAPNNGYFFYDYLLENAHKYLRPQGLLIMELGYGQVQKLKVLSHWQIVKIIRDYANIERFIVLRYL